MDPLVGTLVLIFVALLGARFSFSTERVPEGPRLLFRTGTHFLALGFLLGPAGLGLLSVEATAQLSPFLALGLGWVGFHFGLQLDRASLRHFPLAYYALAFGQAVLTFAIFFGAAGLFVLALGLDDVSPMLLLGAAATASVTTPAGIAMVSSNFLVRGNVRDLLFFTASLDALVGVGALQVIYALYRPEGPAFANGPGHLALVGAALGLGLVMAIVFLWLVRQRPAAEELVLFVLGICAFAAGAALQWNLSPIFVSITMGAVVANFGRDRQRVFALLEKWEKPVYLTFLLLAGALLGRPTLVVIGLALGYALLRALGKFLGAAAMVSTLPMPFAVPRRLGLGLIPQGGISLAMAVSGVLMYPGLQIAGGGAESSLFTIIVIGVMVSELSGPFFTVQLLRRAGEISPHVERALAEGDERQAEREAIRHTVPPARATTEDGS